jgi:hypothetical protein
VTVVAAVEFQERAAARPRARQAQRAHGGLRAGVDEPHHVQGRDHGDDLLGDADLPFRGSAKGDPARAGLRQCLHDSVVSVSEDQWSV